MRLELPAPVLPLASRRRAARLLGLSLEDLDRVARGAVALRDGALLDEGAFFSRFPQDAFDDFTGARALPARLLQRSLVVPRDPSKVLTAPITERDRLAAAAWLATRRLRRLEELKAPSILVNAAKSHLQFVLQPLPARWQPLTELMAGAPAQPGAAGEPSPQFAMPSAPRDASTPGDAAFVDDGVLVSWQYVSLVFGFDGVVRDVFPTRGLRVVGSSAKHVALVCGGGALSESGHFGGEVFVRDLRARRWLPRGARVPKALPRYVSGTVTSLNWGIVVDVEKGVGSRTTPHAAGDQSGETFNSACGRFAWDRERFVLQAATGKAVLDTLPLTGRLLGFAKAARGWRFLMVEKVGEVARVLLKRETGATVRDLGPADQGTVFALSADGARLLSVTASRLELVRADSGAPAGPTWDLSGLGPALAVPAGELWERLAAVFGVASQLNGLTLAAVREAVARTPGDRPRDPELRAALAEAKRRPGLPARVPARS